MTNPGRALISLLDVKWSNPVLMFTSCGQWLRWSRVCPLYVRLYCIIFYFRQPAHLSVKIRCQRNLTVPKLRVPYFSNGTIESHQATLAILHLRLNEQSHNLTIHSAVVSSIIRVILFVKAKILANLHVLRRLHSDSNEFLKSGAVPLFTVTQMTELCNKLEHVRHKFESLPPCVWMRPCSTTWHTQKWVISFMRMRHVTQLHASWHAREWGYKVTRSPTTIHMRMRQITRVNASWHTYE